MAQVQTEQPDLILLDIMMPYMDGYETCRRIRENDETPIIMLSALGEESDKVLALDLGADDYITKPFGVEELLARIRAIFRRLPTSQPPLSQKSQSKRNDRPIRERRLTYLDLKIDQENSTVFCRETPVKLTKTEFELLVFMMQHQGKLLTHESILSEIWGAEHVGQPEYLRVYIRRVRNKIEQDPSNPEYIISEYGAGYRFGAPQTTD